MLSCVVFSESAVHCGTAPATQVSHDGLEGPAELHVEDGVEDWIDCRVGIAEPEQERVKPTRN